LDVVIANAGIANHWGPGASTPIQELESHFRINTVGPLILFQAVLPLLSRSTVPKFVTVSTAVGSIGEQQNYPLPSTAYGTSKAALNYLTRKLHFEHPNIVIYPISPGWVQTEMGTPIAKGVGMEDAPVTIADCVAGVTKSVSGFPQETHLICICD
jgi:norsolorinic acid ketoreductase